MRLRCRLGRHEWGLWQHDTTQVPLMKYIYYSQWEQAGWEMVPLDGPTYHYCKHCPAMERKT